MLIDGINLVEGSKVVNLTVDSGIAFPASPDTGELFYRSDESTLYVYDGAGWAEASGSLPAIPDNEIVIGTGTSIESSPNFTYDPTTGTFEIATQAVATPGNILLYAAEHLGTGDGGSLELQAGNAGVDGAGGSVFIAGGAPGNTTGNYGGSVSIESGNGSNSGDDGNGGGIDLIAGNGGNNAGDGGYVWIEAGGSQTGTAGDVTIASGSSPVTPGVLYFQAGGNSAASVTDNGTYGVWAFEVNPTVTNDSATLDEHLVTKLFVDTEIATSRDDLAVINPGSPKDGDIEVGEGNIAIYEGGSFKDLAQVSYVDTQDAFRVSVTGDSMDAAANLVFTGGGTVTGIPNPTNVNDAANKAYVDNLVASNTSWKPPIECPNFQDVVTAIPGSPVDRGSWIKFGGTQNETWGSITNVVDNDIMEYTTAGGWARLGVLTAGNRFIVAGEVGAAGATITSMEMRAMDLVEYISGDANLTASWFKPQNNNVQGVLFGAVQKTGASATGLANNATVYNATIRVNVTNYPITVTGSAAQTFTNLVAEINADLTGATASVVDGHIHITGDNSTDTILISSGGAPDLWAALTDYSEIRGTVNGGITVLGQNVLCAEYGQTFFYSISNHDWIKISGPGSVGAGTGLSYNGNTMNVNLGAGIQELPSDEVGLDIYPSSGIMTTVDGTNSSTLTNARLSLTKTGVSASTYKSVTVDVYGRITAGTNPTTLAGYGITNAAEINPGAPKNGDVRVTGSVVDIYANGAWRQIFPAVYS